MPTVSPAQIAGLEALNQSVDLLGRVACLTLAVAGGAPRIHGLFRPEVRGGSIEHRLDDGTTVQIHPMLLLQHVEMSPVAVLQLYGEPLIRTRFSDAIGDLALAAGANQPAALRSLRAAFAAAYHSGCRVSTLQTAESESATRIKLVAFLDLSARLDRVPSLAEFGEHLATPVFAEAFARGRTAGLPGVPLLGQDQEPTLAGFGARALAYVDPERGSWTFQTIQRAAPLAAVESARPATAPPTMVEATVDRAAEEVREPSTRSARIEVPAEGVTATPAAEDWATERREPTGGESSSDQEFSL